MESRICGENGNSLSEYKTEFTVPLVLLNVLTAVPATLLNALVIITIWKKPSLQTPSRILLCSLALTDFLVGAVVQLLFVFYFINALTKSSFQIFCLTWAIARRTGYSVGQVTMETLASVSVDRYLAIKTKAAYRSIVTKKRVIIFLMFAWVLGFFVVITTIQLADDKTLPYTTSINMGILLSVIITAYCLSFRALKGLSSQVTHGQSQPNQSHSDFNIWKYKRSLITMVMVLALCLFGYLPMLGYNLAYAYGQKSVAVMHVTEFLIALNSTLNPILYLWRMKDLREAAKQIVF